MVSSNTASLRISYTISHALGLAVKILLLTSLRLACHLVEPSPRREVERGHQVH